MPYDVTSPDNVYSTFEGEVAWPVPLEARTNTTTVNGKQVQEEYNKIFNQCLEQIQKANETFNIDTFFIPINKK